MELVNQTFVNYIGNYDYYLEKKDELTRVYAASSSSGQTPSGLRGAASGEARGASVSGGISSGENAADLPAVLQVPSLTGKSRKNSRPGSGSGKMI